MYDVSMQTYRENIEERARLLQKCKTDPTAKAYVYEQCRRDILFFFDYFLFTDRNGGFYGSEYPSEVPFILFDFQREFVLDLWDAIQEGAKPIEDRKTPTSVFIEKSRQMGLTWLILGTLLYGFLFHNHKYLTISQKEADVDKLGDMRSHFEKLRFMMRNLPQWLLPPGFDKKTKTEYNKSMNISRSDGSGSIQGESANPNASRWGTYNAILFDEMASMANASQINTAAARATPCRIFNSTPSGMWNEYYLMKKMAEKGAFRWHTIHWSEHPFYTQAWYENEKRHMTASQVAQELDIDYNASVEGRIYPEVTWKIEWVEYDESLPLYIGIDNSHVGVDPNAIVVMQTDGHYWNFIDYIEMQTIPEECAAMLWKAPKRSLEWALLQFYMRYIKYKKPHQFVADPYDTHSKISDKTDKTIFQHYQDFGIFLNTDITLDKQEQIRTVKSNLYRCRFNERTIDLVNCLMNSKLEGIQFGDKFITKDNPRVEHDQFSHGRTAFEYLVNYLAKYGVVKEREKTKIQIANPLTWEMEYKYQ